MLPATAPPGNESLFPLQKGGAGGCPVLNVALRWNPRRTPPTPPPEGVKKFKTGWNGGGRGSRRASLADKFRESRLARSLALPIFSHLPSTAEGDHFHPSVTLAAYKLLCRRLERNQAKVAFMAVRNFLCHARSLCHARRQRGCARVPPYWRTGPW